jgi:hypothetical protein
MFNPACAEPTVRDRSLGFISWVLTPWHLKLLAFVRIVLLPTLKLQVAFRFVLGLLDQVIYPLVLNLLLTDPF